MKSQIVLIAFSDAQWESTQTNPKNLDFCCAAGPEETGFLHVVVFIFYILLHCLLHTQVGLHVCGWNSSRHTTEWAGLTHYDDGDPSTGTGEVRMLLNWIILKS